MEILKYVNEYKLSEIAIMTNDFQAERIRAFLGDFRYYADEVFKMKGKGVIEALNYFESDKPKITVIEAENVLPYRNVKYNKLIKDAHDTDAYKRTEAVETGAVAQVRDRSYGKSKKK